MRKPTEVDHNVKTKGKQEATNFPINQSWKLWTNSHPKMRQLKAWVINFGVLDSTP